MRHFAEKIAGFIKSHPIWFIVIAVILSAAAVPGITMLEADTGFDALISPEAKVSVDTARYEQEFGAEPINVLLSGDIDDIFSGENLAALSDFQTAILADPQFRSITGPLSVLQIAVEETKASAQVFQEQLLTAREQAARQARDLAAAAGLDELQQEQAAEQADMKVLQQAQPMIEKFNAIGEISVTNPAFVRSVIFYESGEVNDSFSQFIPDSEHVLVFITPEGYLNDENLLDATRNTEKILSESGFTGIETSVVSFPEIIDAISTGLSDNIILLLGLSVLAMILILVLLFRVRWRLLSLGMVGISALWTFGLMGYISVPLTMTSMALLPILIGLGIDFSIQFQNRYQEEITRTANIHDAIITSISRMFPVVGIALVATIIGFITLYISEVPMIKDFGMMLAIGIVICYFVGLFLLHSIIVLADRKVPFARLQKSAIRASSRIERVLERLGKLAVDHTLWIFIIAVLFAVGGGYVDHLLPVNTDYEQLMPQDDPALMELKQLREIAGVGGSITFMVEADRVDTSEIIAWMNDFQNETVEKHPEILSVTSPAAIVSQASGGIIPSQEEIDTILENTPEFIIEKILSADRSMASMDFTIKYLPVEDIHDLVEEISNSVEPPEEVTISAAGSLIMGAKTMDAVVGSRMKMNFICLGAIFLILLVIYRRLDRTLFSVIPVGAVIAWSSLDMYFIGIPLNPLTAILGVIVIGICTEFMVILTGRYEEEKANGLSPEDAMTTTISRIGRAITTTAVTTLGGFGILIVSDFVLIRDFGIATLLGVLLCLIMTIAVMPGIIVWYDKLKLRRAAKKA